MAGCECEDLKFAKTMGFLQWWAPPGWWMIIFRTKGGHVFRTRITHCFKCGSKLTEEASDGTKDMA